jgi:EmrB/QacA subfamily drug resistance transporter
MSDVELTEIAPTETALAARQPLAHRWLESQWAPLAVLMAGTFMIVLDFFIVNVALPAVQRDLHASAGGLEWVVAGYGLSFAVCLVTAGRLGDRIGRRRVLSLGFVVFTVASAICAAAPTSAVLIAARAVQGVAAALLSANVLSIIGVTYTGRDRVRAISIYGMVMGIASIGGQVVGGALIGADLLGLGWRWVFLINIPIGALAFALAPRLIAESRADRTRGMDATGAGLLTLALTLLVLPLIDGRQNGWPPWAWATLAASPCCIAAFGLYERHLARSGRSPLLDMHLFRERTFSAGLATQLALWCGQASFFFVLALYLQQARGLTPLRSGLVFMIAACAYTAASLRAPMLTARYGRELVAVGALTLALGHASLLLAVHEIGARGNLALLAPGLLLVGAGMGLCITPLTATVLGSADPQQAGAVSGTLSTMQQVGNSLGVAITGVIFFGATRHGTSHAFELSLAELAVLLIGVALLSRLLPRPSRQQQEAS